MPMQRGSRIAYYVMACLEVGLLTTYQLPCVLGHNQQAGGGRLPASRRIQGLCVKKGVLGHLHVWQTNDQACVRGVCCLVVKVSCCVVPVATNSNETVLLVVGRARLLPSASTLSCTLTWIRRFCPVARDRRLKMPCASWGGKGSWN